MAKTENIIELTDKNFKEEVEGAIPILVDFWATWCGPCKAVAPTISKLAEKYAGKIKVGKVNIDDSAAIAQEFGIQTIPTFLMFKNGKVSGVTIGVATLAKLEELVGKALS
jgi:thioredoxin 1